MRPFKLIATLFAAGCAVAACSSSSSSSSADDVCPANLFGCPAGQSCWAKDNTFAFACIPSGTGTKGSTCQSTVGVAACGEGLACLQLQGASTGTCVPYCQPGSTGRGCEAGEQCAQALLQGAKTVLNVCVGSAAPVSDAGADAATDAADAATD